MMDRMGSKVLQEILNDILGKHIRDKLPGIKSSLKQSITKMKVELKSLGFYEKCDEHSVLPRTQMLE